MRILGSETRNKGVSGQEGFTLVENAIGLVIIVLLIGGVLRGQTVITNAKVINIIKELNGVSTAYYMYLDNFKAMPGDDNLASTRFTGAVNGGGNGVIAGLYDAVAAPAAGNESNNFWQHVRMAGLLSGTATAAQALPSKNTFGGYIGVQQPASTFGMPGVVVCAGSVPWGIAKAIDDQIDDGDSATGAVRTGAAGAANQATAAATAAVYGPTVAATAALQSGIHTLCMQM